MNDPGKGPGRSSEQPVFRSLGRRRRHRSGGPPYGLIGGLVLLAVVAGGAWYWFGMRGGEETPPTAAATDTAETAPGTTRPDAPPLDLPELDASDVLVREMVSGLSSHPRLAEWLVTEDLALRFVTSVVNIAAGGSPAEHLGFMAPEGSFQVRRSDGRLVVDSASYARYDPVVQAFVSLDTEDGARLYRQLHPLFQEAYRELGMTERTFDETMAVAVGNLLAVEIPEGPVEVEPTEAVYAYRDPDLEAATPAEKHLLRLGPENARRVQAKLEELASAVGIEPRPAGDIGG